LLGEGVNFKHPEGVEKEGNGVVVVKLQALMLCKWSEEEGKAKSEKKKREEEGEREEARQETKSERGGDKENAVAKTMRLDGERKGRGGEGEGEAEGKRGEEGKEQSGSKGGEEQGRRRKKEKKAEERDKAKRGRRVVRVCCMERGAKFRHTLRKEVWVGFWCGFSVSVSLFFGTGTSTALSHRGDVLARSRANR